MGKKIHSATAKATGLLLGAGLLARYPAGAQGLTLEQLTPAPNTAAAARSSAVVAAFNQTLLPAAAGALRVFSAQHGGLLTAAAPAVVAGSVLRFAPPGFAFRPGEKVALTVTRAAASSTGQLATPQVVQFTAAVGGTGRGQFGGGQNLAAGATQAALGDVDGDGDLDLLTNEYAGSSVGYYLNDGTGSLGSRQTLALSGQPTGLTLGDVDGDGDLDLAVALPGGVSVRLNSGAGAFGAGQTYPLGAPPNNPQLADLDGDGDLDLLTEAYTSGTVSVYYNDGAGGFGSPWQASVGSNIRFGALGDVDNDGDLDFIGDNYVLSLVIVRLNDGQGHFTAGTRDFSVAGASAGYPASVATGDLDHDGDLDLALGTYGNSTITIASNDGAGTFGVTQAVALTGYGLYTTLADVDADGDLDLLATDATSARAELSFNNGHGTFAGDQLIALAGTPNYLTLGDLDQDGDLDLLSVNQGSASVRLNNGTGPLATRAPAASGLALYPNPASQQVALRLPDPATAVELLDCQGRLVRTYYPGAHEARLSLAGLAGGLYLVRAGSYTSRLVVE